MASMSFSLMKLQARVALEAPNVEAAEQCARPVANDVGDPLGSNKNLTLHKFMIYLSFVCTILTIISTLFLNWRHLHRYKVPQEQRQIIRIINLPAAYAIFNLLALIWYQYYLYVEPIAGIYEAFTVASLFFLNLEYVAPDGTDREQFFEKLEAKDKKGNIIPGGSLKWFQRTWTSCLQYPLTKLVFVVIQIITQYFDVYCENSFKPDHAHLYLQLLDWFLIGGALGACIKFILRFKGTGLINPRHNSKYKTFSFIGIIVFQILQDLIFHLMNGKLFHPGKVATYNDLNFGIPSTLTCVEALVFSAIFHWSFGPGEYKDVSDRYGGSAERQSTFRAILNALNLSDIVAGVILALQLLFMRVSSNYGGSNDSGMGMQAGKYWRQGDSSHLEPLSSQNRLQGYSEGQYSPPFETENNPHSSPAMPMGPAMPDHTHTYNSNLFVGDNSYQPIHHSREPSPMRMGQQNPRDIV